MHSNALRFILSTLLLMCSVSYAIGQISNLDSLTNEPLNSANNIIKGNSSKNITIGGYAQIDYNQNIGDGTHENGVLDVHRFVLFLGYKFNDRTHFVTEIEWEHVTEVYVEQAFLNYRFNSLFNFRAGLMLVPMGIINEYHEPTIFNGVERPNLDKFIVPSTWRELGLGFSGNIQNLSLKYQAYLMNGFNGYNYSGEGTFSRSNGLRSGRQKGATSYISSPNLSSKVDFYGVQGLKIGLAGYFGKSQSSLYSGLDKNDLQAIAQADSSIVDIAMVGLDARYQMEAFTARGQLVNAKIQNTNQYNSFTGQDLGSRLFGYYLEAGFNVLHYANTSKKLTFFARYEKYDTHKEVKGELLRDRAQDRTDITLGATLHVANGAALKMDYQRLTNQAVGSEKVNVINAGVGIWF